MNDLILRRNDCRLCCSDRLELALALAASPIGDLFIPRSSLDKVQELYPLDLFLCQDCGHVQLLDVINPEILYNDYIYTTTSSPGLPEHFDAYAEEVLSRLNLPQNSLVVDIGSNDGTLLRIFKNHKLRVLGVEPAKHIAQEASDSGIETLPAFFDVNTAKQIRAKHGPATLVTANNVFANIDNLPDLVFSITALLAEDGNLIIETGYLADLVQNTIFDNVYHEHLGYHSVLPLKTFLENQGMEVIDTQWVQSKGGSIRVTAQLNGGPRPVSKSVKEFIRHENSIGAHSVDTYRAMGKKLEGIKSQITTLVQAANSKGQSVVGYGASQSATTLMYHFGLQNSLDFLVDDNPVKQGLYSPRCHIPVLSPNELYERNPDYVMVLAWRFAKSMIDQHQPYRDQGGRFIVPLPDVAVL